MLIDRMKTHPHEFAKRDSQFRDLLDAAQRTLHTPATASVMYQMSRRDAAAIMHAAETILFEPWLAERVLAILIPPKDLR